MLIATKLAMQFAACRPVLVADIADTTAPSPFFGT
jgi:hypothetical protein